MSHTALDIEFSVDLIKASLFHVDFLKEVNSLKFTPEQITRAVYRYEKLWLPFCIKNNSVNKILFPPIDVAFVWHCHMLNPTSYANDCSRLYNRIIDYKLLSNTDRSKYQAYTKPIWESSLNCSFDYSNANNCINSKNKFLNFKSKFEYDLVEASKRQSTFYYQVSLPHFRNEEFLTMSLDRYKKFLTLRKCCPEEFIVPCYGIDLIWHSHQLHPIDYGFDTKRITGSLFPHDDSTNDRSTGSKLDTSFKSTRDLWKLYYQEDFFFPGGMFRGIIVIFFKILYMKN